MTHRTRVVLLGTAGGSPYWAHSDRAGIASAVVVGDRYYLVDAGREVVRQPEHNASGSRNTAQTYLNTA